MPSRSARATALFRRSEEQGTVRLSKKAEIAHRDVHAQINILRVPDVAMRGKCSSADDYGPDALLHEHLAEKQALTEAWWENHRHRYELVTSASVLDEARSGDAFHVAFASASQVGFLLTWNCTHLANESSRWPIERWLRRLDKHIPVTCTPRGCSVSGKRPNGARRPSSASRPKLRQAGACWQAVGTEAQAIHGGARDNGESPGSLYVPDHQA